MKKLDDNFRFALKMLIMGENPAEGGAETMKGFMQNLSWFSGISADSFVCFLANSKKSFQCFRKSSMKFCEKF